MRFKPLLLSSLLLSAASAQQPSTLAAIEDNPRFRETAEKTFLQYEQSLSTHCTLIHPDWTKATSVIYVPPAMDAQGKLATASWSQLVPGDACGQPRRFRALVTVRDGRTGLSRQLPGTSNASPALERDVRTSIAGAVKVHLPQADLPPSIDVFDTTLVGDALPAAHQAWSEIWLIGIGTRRMKIPIDFLPDATGQGTSFHIDPKTITDLP